MLDERAKQLAKTITGTVATAFGGEVQGRASLDHVLSSLGGYGGVAAAIDATTEPAEISDHDVVHAGGYLQPCQASVPPWPVQHRAGQAIIDELAHNLGV